MNKEEYLASKSANCSQREMALMSLTWDEALNSVGKKEVVKEEKSSSSSSGKPGFLTGFFKRKK